jgi:precorrin-3B C17-methyltransferase
VETVAGYGTYLDLIAPLLEGKRIIRSGMTREVERVSAAIEAALGGSPTALVSSGDPGIYAMAGLVFEICIQRRQTLCGPSPPFPAGSLPLEVVPGIPALCAGAALLGAPLTHDFAVVSLSDLLTPWERIAARIEAAARADFVVVLYNPRSRRRAALLPKAQAILLAHRDGATPTGIVTGAMRPNQAVQIVPLAELHLAAVDMQSTVFVGSSASVRYLDHMLTPRGYGAKYPLSQGAGALR